MGYFDNAIIWLDQIGVADVIVPFFLVFAIVFGVLQKTKILGDPREKKNLNVIIALLLGLAVVFPHVTGKYPSQYDVVEIMNMALPQVSLVIVAVIMVLLLIGLFGGEANWVTGPFAGLIALLAFVLVVYIFGAAANIWGYAWWLDWLRDPDTQALIIVLLVFGLITYFIVREPEKSHGEGMLKNISDFFRRPGH
ncbi:MAG TPA: hypothetical protein VJC00_03810 [Candidatus Nanoarchaeia archaeon]|nr:hypothetical protein [Candidatus Nanoarchaeia archaeon]